MKTPNQIIGAEVKRLRIKSRRSQIQLAKFLGIHQTALSRIENGDRYLSIHNAIRLKDKIGLDIYSIYGEEMKWLARI